MKVAQKVVKWPKSGPKTSIGGPKMIPPTQVAQNQVQGSKLAHKLFWWPTPPIITKIFDWAKINQAKRNGCTKDGSINKTARRRGCGWRWMGM